MIAEGRRSAAEDAAEELRRALAAAELAVHGVVVEPEVWDGRNGPVRLVGLGAALPDTVLALADLVRRGSSRTARLPELRDRVRELNRWSRNRP